MADESSMDNEVPVGSVIGPSGTKMVDKEVEKSIARENNATVFRGETMGGYACSTAPRPRV